LCPIQFSFSVDICLLSAENRNISQPVNWDNCKKDEFVEYLTVNKDNEIKSIVNRLDDMLLLQDVSIQRPFGSVLDFSLIIFAVLS
jgi:uncharacterized protein with ACT and thioredoxin-like domain